MERASIADARVGPLTLSSLGAARRRQAGPAVRMAQPDFELIVGQPRQSFRWNVHDYPFPLAKWHYHPEYELHLIQESSGKMFVGDYIGNFDAGVFVLTGPNLPHNWVSDIAPGEVVKDRDMLIQFGDGVLRDLMRVCPELEEITPLLDDARYGIEFSGDDARIGARLLRQIGGASPTRRVLLFLELLDLLHHAKRRKILSSREYSPTLDHDVSELINKTIDFLIDNLTEDVRLTDVAQRCGMSDSAFSRFFKKNTGHGFVRYVNRMRVNRACTLLTQTTTPITDICFETGFNNLSNFNRQFLSLCGVTPSEYRRQSQRNATCSTELFSAEPREEHRAYPRGNADGAELHAPSRLSN